METYQRKASQFAPYPLINETVSYMFHSDPARDDLDKLYSTTQAVLVQGLYIPPSANDAPPQLKEIPQVERSLPRDKALKRLLKVSVPPAILVSLFSWKGVLEGLGKMSLSEWMRFSILSYTP
jgi:hypothetical protein